MGSCFPVKRLFYNILSKREAIWPWIHAPIPVIEICVPPKLLWLVSWSGQRILEAKNSSRFGIFCGGAKTMGN